MSKPKTRTQWNDDNYLNVTTHAGLRAIERSSEISRKDNLEDHCFRDVRNPEKIRKTDSNELIYCRSLELLGVRDGKKLVTVLPYPSNKMKLVAGKFAKQEKKKKNKNPGLPEEVRQDLDARIFER